jgi:hypothetical protein
MYLLRYFNPFHVILISPFQAYDSLEEAVKSVDYEIKKTKDKVKRDSESLNDSHDFIKVCLASIFWFNPINFRLKRSTN